GHFLRDAAGVHVGGIEEIDAGLDRAAVEWLAGVFVEHPAAPFRGAVGHGAETQAGNLETGVAEANVLHDGSRFGFGQMAACGTSLSCSPACDRASVPNGSPKC